ncbi:hypothetical protein, partial [Amnibacterium sp.]|uniref:hypothetical protein n=1 Tax=Amnibacterium sp. TaxID=1872496 RepID=UPI00261F0666
MIYLRTASTTASVISTSAMAPHYPVAASEEADGFVARPHPDRGPCHDAEVDQQVPRWDNDDVFRGAGTAAWLLPSLAELQRLAEEPGWVAEAPETHLAPHLRAAVDAAGFTWLCDRIDSDGTY